MGRLFALVTVAILGVMGFGQWQEVRHFLRQPIHIPKDNCYYIVPPGAGLPATSQGLAEQGIIDHPYYFFALGGLRGAMGQIRAGEYRLQASLTPDKLLDLLISGRVAQHSVTLVEGWTFAQVRETISLHDRLDHQLDGASDAGVMAALDEEGQLPEGLFFPDTYHFPAGTSDVAFLQRARRTLEHHLQREWQNRAPHLPYLQPYDALIMASIIEKESASTAERPAIAGVFVRRLLRNMPLQTDPTIIYGLGEAFTGNLRRVDLQTDGPYNTYTRRGLPPTPIALVSLGALRAALHPAEGDSLYFVAKGDGTHQFSATLEQHNSAVRRYQLRKGTKPPG